MNELTEKGVTPETVDLTNIPILLRRRIEAMILSHVLEVVTERHSRAEAEAIIGEACSKSAIEQGAGLREKNRAEKGRDPTFEDFENIMPQWRAGGALETEVIEVTDDKMDFNVTRCKYSEMYREMGLGDIGHLLSCNRDGDFCIGYNPDMELTRTQTLMKGASHCDFRYRMKGEN
ncbi:L-2-amino-thiazoline-4-carboxylic acid hydrolase [Sulfitobacter albidus]|uniref:L-2-amino-thiazoline-4-carboxylic acid hydrolase n=1 Tax=Sulfitobacter albidus TaxID=2829501 RepID=A0A975JE78_9RHOB|nr:L-2-amino-thiazoline-4-carboxylic acid hydrolase [Sulfitobacter albidus]QUJ76722.1 L-2-amino-thiazoline-4-carboxylic acid hydrolase [Sulfitobacter albidus]